VADWFHQAYEYKIGKQKRGRGLLWPMRSGKSKGIIDKANFLFKHKEIEGAIVLAPNGVHINWSANEIPKWSWRENGRFGTFAWSTPKRGDLARINRFSRLLHFQGMKWFTVNKEALNHPECQAALRKFMVSCHNKFMLIVDESHHFARPGAKRTRLARGLAKKAVYREIATGTVILNSPLRAFSQFEILQESALGFDNYTDFKERYAIIEQRSIPGRRRTREVITGYQNMDELRERMAKWSSVVVREDIHDMPELLRTERPVIMSEKQRFAYLEMVSRHIVEIGDDLVGARDGGARVTKLHQIANGYIVASDTGQIHTIDDEAPIYEAMLEQVGGTLPGKSIVWCRFREDVRRVVKYLETHGYPGKVLTYFGDTPMDEREPLRVQFNTDPNIFALVGTLGTGGEGLDFSGADAVIFFSIPPNTVQVKQGEERATAVGGKTVTVVRITTPGTVVDRLWSIIDGNSTLADSVSGRGLRDLLRATDI
jgi:SNF2 family DNA or RNA helicase